MSITVKHQLTLSEQEECWGSSRTLRVTAAVKESTGRSSTQECSATQRETVFSQQHPNVGRIASAEEHTQRQGRIARTIRKE